MPLPREPAQDAEATGQMPDARNLAAEVALRLGSGAVSLAVARIFGVRDIGPALHEHVVAGGAAVVDELPLQPMQQIGQVGGR